jgi:hypothetical protein
MCFSAKVVIKAKRALIENKKVGEKTRLYTLLLKQLVFLHTHKKANRLVGFKIN